MKTTSTSFWFVFVLVPAMASAFLKWRWFSRAGATKVHPGWLFPISIVELVCWLYPVSTATKTSVDIGLVVLLFPVACYLNSLLWRDGSFLQVTKKAILSSLILPGIVALELILVLLI